MPGAIRRDRTMRASFGEAWRFPTVGELYQIVTTPVAAVPNPNLRPERALSEELAIERHDAHGTIRLSLFNEDVKDAPVSQTGPLAGTDPVQVGTYARNVGRTRARGVEPAVERRDLLPRVDLSPMPMRRPARILCFPPPSAAARYASRSFGALDNSDTPIGASANIRSSICAPR